jgi:hypothetical protein
MRTTMTVADLQTLDVDVVERMRLAFVDELATRVARDRAHIAAWWPAPAPEGWR